MFAYCRSNPVRRVDISGSMDQDCYDNDPYSEEDLLKTSEGGGGAAFAKSSQPSGNTFKSGNGTSSGQAKGDGGSSGKGYSYTAPPGGGGVTSSTQVGDMTVTFGHGGRHMDFSDISGLENAIANDVVMRANTVGQYGRASLLYGGNSFTYHFMMRSSTLIHVGTYYYTVAK